MNIKFIHLLKCLFDYF